MSNKECATHVYLIYVCRLMFDIVPNAFLKNVYTEAKKLHSLSESLKKDDFRRICHASKLDVFQSYLNLPNYLQRFDKSQLINFYKEVTENDFFFTCLELVVFQYKQY